MACYEIQPIPNKGNGLVATYDIAPGTRILSEKPLFTVPAQAEATMDFYIIAKAKLLTKDEQRQFLSLHNSHQDKNIFRSIFETNALPCGPGSTTGAVYPTICLINHSCAPNSYVSWNSDARSQTIHALRNIGVGEEITISYYHPNKTFRKRQTYLKEHFKFDCACEVCSLPLTDRKQSDVRRLEIEELDEVFFTPGRTVLKPEAAMLDRYKLLQLLEEEYKGSAKVFESDAYEELVQLCISRGDEVRVSCLSFMLAVIY
jgi:hypothetical protein